MVLQKNSPRNDFNHEYLKKLIANERRILKGLTAQIAACKEIIGMFQKYSWLQIKQLSEAKAATVDSFNEKHALKRATRLRLEDLQDFGLPQDQKPLIPRPDYTWFRKGDIVVFYIDQRQGYFKKALVHSEAEFHIPHIQIKDGTQKTGGAYDFFHRSPLIMHPWEFYYMHRHPEFLPEWIEEGRKYEPETGFPENYKDRKIFEARFSEAIRKGTVHEMGTLAYPAPGPIK